MTSRSRSPAFYAAPGRRGGDWWTLLHPPYTLWHLSYVVIGGSIASQFDSLNLAATVAAFFLAVGLSAHALDELNGRPLRTRIPTAVLWIVACSSLTGAVAIGVAGVTRVGIGLIPFVVVGALLVLAYNLELLGGRLHDDFVFAASWGSFPVLTAYYAQAQTIDAPVVLAAAAAFLLSSAQRRLSTPARRIRRKAVAIEGSMTLDDGTTTQLDAAELLRPLEGALKALSWSIVLLSLALLAVRVL